MGVFDQMGDPVCPVCPDCLCQHHGVAYAERQPPAGTEYPTVLAELIADGGTIVQVGITTTERCCIVVNAAVITGATVPVTALEIERPVGTIRTLQEDEVTTTNLRLMHHATWEVLDAGTYTYFLVNRGGFSLAHHAAWIKAVASDCEG